MSPSLRYQLGYRQEPLDPIAIQHFGAQVGNVGIAKLSLHLQAFAHGQLLYPQLSSMEVFNFANTLPR